MAMALRRATVLSGLAPRITFSSMRHMSVRALVVSKPEKRGPAVHEIVEVPSVSELPRQHTQANVVVDVAHSSLNYKDGLALTGAPGVVREYPIVPGIDVAGTVSSSSHPGVKVGDKVLTIARDCGQGVDGGYATQVSVPGDWLVPLPPSFSLRETMVLGTAGFTAMQCIHHLMTAGRLQQGETGEVLVTGAAGGVGSVTISLLSAMGFNVTASSGRADELEGYLKELGATSVIGRLEKGKPLERERWAAVVDTVGGDGLATAIAGTRYCGAVAACGVAGGPAVPTTVFPFILRGVRLLGVDSVQAPQEERLEVWGLLEKHLPREALEAVTVQDVGLGDLEQLGKDILAGAVRGRVVVNPSL